MEIKMKANFCCFSILILFVHFENIHSLSSPKSRKTSRTPIRNENKQKIQNKNNKILDSNSELGISQTPQVKSFAQKTIWGQNIINCRSFNIDAPKKYEFLGSHTNEVPIYPSPEICFIGRSNVGKSSLLNCLTGLNKNIAVESKVPGRTRAINLFRCSDKIGPICTFVDLPGYGYAQMSKETQEDVISFVRSYLNDRGSLRLALFLIDIRREPQGSDLAMVKYLEESGIPFCVIATKCDKLKKDELSHTLVTLKKAFNLEEGQPLPFSSITGLGKRPLWHLIRDGIVGTVDETDDNGDAEEEGEGGGEGQYYEEEEEEDFDVRR